MGKDKERKSKGLDIFDNFQREVPMVGLLAAALLHVHLLGMSWLLVSEVLWFPVDKNLSPFPCYLTLKVELSLVFELCILVWAVAWDACVDTLIIITIEKLNKKN